VIAIILLLRGVCTQHTDMWRGTRWTTQFLYGHEARLLSVTRMKPEVFKKLLNLLQEHGDFKDTKLLSAAEKLVIFLMIFSNNTSYKLLSEIIQHSSATIH
jgi:hypothetical protein